MSLENFKNRKIEWDTVNKNFDQSVQVISGDVNSRTVTIVINDNGEPIDLTGYSVKLIYKYIYSDSSGFVMLTPIDAEKGEFSLTIPTEMTAPGSIKSNLILLNENLKQVIVSKSIKFISDDSTVTDLAQEVNNKIDDFTKLLFENMPQVMRSELNDLHAQTDSNTSNIDLKANSSDMTSLQSAISSLQNKVEAFGITPENLVTIKSLLEAIANNATDSEVAELINSINILTSNIALMSNNGDYSPKANQTDLESLQSAVNNQAATISTKANKTDLDNLQTTVKKRTGQWQGLYKTFTTPIDGTFTFSAFVKGDGTGTEIYSVIFINGVDINKFRRTWTSSFDWTRDSVTLNLKANDVVLVRYVISVLGTNQALWTAGHKWEEGSIATPWMPSSSEVTTADWPKYVGFSNTIKPNKIYSDYKWLPMGLISIDSDTGLLKPAVIGVDYAQAHPIGSVVSNSSNSSSGYTTGTWQNIGSEVIGSTTIYYWKRTA